MADAVSAASIQRADRVGPLPYLTVGLLWFAFLILALRVRLIEPVFWWVLTQGLLVEKVSNGFWGSRVLLFACYMVAAVVAWWIVERPGRHPKHVWRRAILSWIGIQLIYAVIAVALVSAGVLYE